MSAPDADASALTPREVVAELDRYIVGQQAAKRAVAIALRNRWRRRRVPAEIGDEIAPKNIILVGATGVGKTEIARRLARLAQAPFVKVEASKFTEVGYVGRDCDAMVRDLVEAAVGMVRKEAQARVMVQAESLAEERLLDLLLPPPPGYAVRSQPADDDASRRALRASLRKGDLDGREVEVEVTPRAPTPLGSLGAQNQEDLGAHLQDLMGQVMGQRKPRRRRVKVPEARTLLQEQEAQRLVDQEAVQHEAVRRAEQGGIIFLDEIDKIARREGSHGGPDISREGVQRDILPIVEGAVVTTKHGPVRTDHVLFIAAGAFHVSRVSDLIPELQGRFPIRVELTSLGQPELLRVLVEPQNALPVQYRALLAAEGVDLRFTADGLREIARVAFEANQRAENIGARRLHTIFEKLLEGILFTAPDQGGSELEVDAAYVGAHLGDVLASEELERYIL